MDALFNNKLTGHNHGGAHQGGPLTIGGGQIADGSITSPKIADGSIQTIDLADGSVTSTAKLSPAYRHRRATSARRRRPTLPTRRRCGSGAYYAAGTGQGSWTGLRPGTGTVYGPALVIGSTVSLHVGGTPVLTANADMSVSFGRRDPTSAAAPSSCTRAW